MNTISQVFSIILPILYLAFVIYYGYIFFGRNKKLESKTPLMLTILLVFHAMHIILRGTAIATIPLSTKFDALSFLAFSIILLSLIIELSLETKASVFFALILSFIIQTSSYLLYNWNLTQHPLLSNPIYAVHVVLTILGYTGICISALYALLYILLNHNIKYHRLGIVYEKLPSLRLLEQMSIRSVQVGIISLGLGILLGHLHAGNVLGTHWPWDAKVIFSDGIWLGYFTGYIIAQLRRWRGRWMAYLSMVGFGILILTNVTIIFIQDTFHQFQ
jgi:ABC-type transport system involved in cytochrome c biogenesis permease subunit